MSDQSCVRRTEIWNDNRTLETKQNLGSCRKQIRSDLVRMVCLDRHDKTYQTRIMTTRASDVWCMTPGDTARGIG